MTTGEIITLQLGSFSNFIGAHFWNLQQEQCNIDATAAARQEDAELSGISQSALFSEHLSRSSCSTFRPRLVITDLRGALGACNGTSDEINAPPDTWEGHFVPVKEHYVVPKHPYQTYLEGRLPCAMQRNPELPSTVCHKTFQFSKTVRSFSDYMMIDWVPSNHVELLTDYTLGVDAFLSSHLGDEVAHTTTEDCFWERLTNRYRHQLEQADSVSAVHVLVDWQTGFSGLGTATITWLNDNIAKTPIVVLGSEPAYPHTSPPQYSTATELSMSMVRRLSGAVLLGRCVEDLHSGSVILLSDYNTDTASGRPSVQRAVPAPDMSTWYEASALPAVALDTFSLPYRVEGYATVSTARSMYERVTLGADTGPLITAFLGCPVPAHVFQRDKRCTVSSSLWDISRSPLSPQSATASDIEVPFVDYNQHLVSRGLTSHQESLLMTSFASPERYFCSPHPTHVPVPFPQFFPPSSAVEDTRLVTSLTCLRPFRGPREAVALQRLYDATERASKLGSQSFLTAQLGFDKETLRHLHSLLVEQFGCQDEHHHKSDEDDVE